MNREVKKPDTFQFLPTSVVTCLTKIYPARISKYNPSQIWQILQSSSAQQFEQIWLMLLWISHVILGDGWVFPHLCILLEGAADLRQWALSVLWKCHCLVPIFLNEVYLLMPWEYIRADRLVFYQKTVSTSSKVKVPALSDHFGCGLMSPVFIVLRVLVVHPKGFHL